MRAYVDADRTKRVKPVSAFVPDGWMLVPVDPMLIAQAALDESRKWDEDKAPLPRGRELWAAEVVYRAMLAAVPKPPFAEQHRNSEAESVLNTLESGEWELRRHLPQDCLTDEANKRNAWSVMRAAAPFCTEDGVRVWSGPTPIAALRAGAQALGVKPLSQAPVAENHQPSDHSVHALKRVAIQALDALRADYATFETWREAKNSAIIALEEVIAGEMKADKHDRISHSESLLK